MADYYVSPTGSGDQSGSSSANAMIAYPDAWNIACAGTLGQDVRLVHVPGTYYPPWGMAACGIEKLHLGAEVLGTVTFDVTTSRTVDSTVFSSGVSTWLQCSHIIFMLRTNGGGTAAGQIFNGGFLFECILKAASSGSFYIYDTISIYSVLFRCIIDGRNTTLRDLVRAGSFYNCVHIGSSAAGAGNNGYPIMNSLVHRGHNHGNGTGVYGSIVHDPRAGINSIPVASNSFSPIIDCFIIGGNRAINDQALTTNRRITLEKVGYNNPSWTYPNRVYENNCYQPDAGPYFTDPDAGDFRIPESAKTKNWYEHVRRLMLNVAELQTLASVAGIVLPTRDELYPPTVRGSLSRAGRPRAGT